MVSRPVALGSVALVAFATACSGGPRPAPFRLGASEGGYTVLYDPRGLPPHTGDGPCVQMVPNAGIGQAETGLGQVDCTGSTYDLDVQQSPLGDNRIAVWGVLPTGASTVTVASRPATVAGHTFLAIMAKPAGPYLVVAQDRSGHQVAAVGSDRLPPPVPDVSW